MRLKLLIPSARSDFREELLAAVAATFLVLVAALTATLRAPTPAPPEPVTTGPSHRAPEVPDPWPLSLIPEAERVIDGRFRSGNTLAGILYQAGIDPELVDAVVRAAQPTFDLRRLRAGRPYRIYFNGADELLLFRYQPSAQTAMVVARRDDGFEATQIIPPYQVRPGFFYAEIHGSLEGSLARTSLGRRGAIDVAQKLADVFAWDIDFAADLRLGDRIDVLVEQRFLEGEFAGYGEILAAELRVRGSAVTAVRFDDEELTSYFTPEGKSLRRTFLRSPVQYTRISSRFTTRRYHPILKTSRPHYGVDYAAPPGTPVQATADGVISYVGSNFQAGRYLKIRHGGSYTSWYLHLSRFAEGLRVGRKVAQGQTIGYVGKSGLATSYHLDYRLDRNGQFVDPLKVQFATADPVPSRAMVTFESQRDRWIGLLRAGQTRVDVAMAAADAGS